MQGPIRRVGPPPNEARTAIILIHGRGSSGDDIAGLANAVPSTGVSWLAPSAPTGSWYPQRFMVPTVENEPELSAALAVIDGLVEELKGSGLPLDHIGFAGFSQGACLALEYAARNPARYAFVAALSGALIGPEDTPRSEFDLQRTPVLLGCADHDAHIPSRFVDHSEQVLTSANALVARQRFPGNAHTVFPAELEWIHHALEALNHPVE